MAKYYQELLGAARRLLARRTGQPGRLSTARIRRSISTSYYALFYFLIEESSMRLVGSHNNLRRRRRILMRSYSHQGIKTTLDKVKGPNVDQSVADFFRTAGASTGPVPSPPFVQSLARAFSDAQAKRYDADYNLNEPLSEADARLLRARVRRVIDAWNTARTPAEKDFKDALCILMVLRGQLRQLN